MYYQKGKYMIMYRTNCPADWAAGATAFLGGWGKTDLGALVDLFSEVICMETGKCLPVEVVYLAAVIQSGLPDQHDYDHFIQYFPAGEVKNKIMEHLKKCRESYYWGRYWKGWYRTQP
jgi:hypothetical protein